MVAEETETSDTERVRSLVRQYMDLSDTDLSVDNIVAMLSIFDLTNLRNSFSYIIPTQQLAMYIIERFYYLPFVTKLIHLRSLVMNDIKKNLDLRWFGHTSLHQEFEAVINQNSERMLEKGAIDRLYAYIEHFLDFFLQLAAPQRRFAERTFLLLYERTPKMETLLKFEDRQNFVISKEIEGRDYLQLVFDTLRSEKIMGHLPYQFMHPKVAMIIDHDIEVIDLGEIEFTPDLLIYVGEKISEVKTDSTCYLLNLKGKGSGRNSVTISLLEGSS